MKNRTAGHSSARRFKEMNQPPSGQFQNWIWITREMLESAAWAAMPLYARRILDRVVIEHLNHGGKHNGELKVTYDNFVRFGVRRASVRAGIAVAVALGFLDVVEVGIRGYGLARRPTIYGLTWLPRRDWTPPSNRWRRFSADDVKPLVDRRTKGKIPEPEGDAPQVGRTERRRSPSNSPSYARALASGHECGTSKSRGDRV